MRHEVVMPKMGESLQEGTITKWMKQIGDLVERDEMILEISTDKVDTEVPSPIAGKLVEILTQENETVEVGTVVAIIDTDTEASDQAPSKPAAATEPVSQPEKIISKEAQSPKKVSQTTQPVSDNDVEVVMPKMGESLQEGTITKWLKKVGEAVERDEMILEISTDKVDTEVPSPIGGILSAVLVNEGETVEVGTVIAKIASGDTSTKSAATQVDNSVNNANQVDAPKQPDSATKHSTIVANVEIDAESGFKEIPSRYNGKFFSPLVRSIAEKEGVTLQELDSIKGSGVENRITKQDILNYIQNRSKSPQATQQSPTQSKTKPIEPAPTKSVPTQSFDSGEGDVEIIKMDRIRQLIADHMSYSKHTSAHVTSVAEVDLTSLVKFREKVKNQFQKDHGFKITYTPFVIKACIDAVKQFPMVNVSVGEKEIIRHRRIHFGFATALPDNNLIVPVIKFADEKNISGLARSVWDLSSRARNKKLNPDDIQGGTITLTNVGTFGTLFGTPIINQPQTVIFGIGAIKKKPVVKEIEGEDVIVIRHMAYISITYDHRVIDGMLAGQTLAAVVKSLESMSEHTISI